MTKLLKIHFLQPDLDGSVRLSLSQNRKLIEVLKPDSGKRPCDNEFKRNLQKAFQSRPEKGEIGLMST